MFLIMFCMPVISTFLLMRSSASQKHRTFSVIAWGLAATLGTFLALSAEVIHPVQLWGIWLFILLTVVLLAFELLTAWLEKIPRVDVPNDVDNPATGQDQRANVGNPR